MHDLNGGSWMSVGATCPITVTVDGSDLMTIVIGAAQQIELQCDAESAGKLATLSTRAVRDMKARFDRERAVEVTGSDLASGPPAPDLQREYGPGELLMTSGVLAGYLRDAAGECEYQAVRLDSPPLRRLAAASGTLIRHLAQIAETPTEPIAVSTWFVLHTAPDVTYQGTHHGVTLTLTTRAEAPTRLTVRIDPTTPVLDRLTDLLEGAHTEYHRDKDVDPRLYHDADVAPGQQGVPTTTVTLGTDTLMNFEVDPVHDVVHLYVGSWSTPTSSAVRLDLRDPGPTLDTLLTVVHDIKRQHATLHPDRQTFSGPAPRPEEPPPEP